MVTIYLRAQSAEELIPVIKKQHRMVWNYNKVYLHYPVLQRWKLKSKEQHFKSIRYQKGKNFVCKWCPNRNCNYKINTIDDFYDHITQVSLNKCTFSLLTQNQYRERRGWEPVNEETTQQESTKQMKSTTSTSVKLSKTQKKVSFKSTEKVKSRSIKRNSKQNVKSISKSSTNQTQDHPIDFTISREITCLNQLNSINANTKVDVLDHQSTINELNTNEIVNQMINQTSSQIDNQITNLLVEQKNTKLNQDNEILMSNLINLTNESNKKNALKQRIDTIVDCFISSLPDDFEQENLKILITKCN